MTQPLTRTEARQARDLAGQRLAFAHDGKRLAADQLARVVADPNSTAAEIAEATEALSEATALYRQAHAAADQARRDEVNVSARRGGQR
ncbi:hypothetical protein ACFWDN_31310 [Micromonospora chalcea]